MWDKDAKQAHIPYLANGKNDKIYKFTNFTKLFIYVLVILTFINK